MDRRRLGFLLALTLFVGWVLALGSLAWLSGSRPATRPQAAGPR